MDMKTYFKELVYKICASARLQIVIWGGQFNPNLSNKITFFHNVKE